MIALVVLASVPAVGAAAVLALPPVEEQVVEGHTVFTVLETVRNATSAREEFAAAVAVLVQEINFTRSASRFPGVLWFNDQYLVEPDGSSSVGGAVARHPCRGAVLAVNRGAGDPRAMELSDATYVESYLFKDPHDRDWVVDKFAPNGTFVWTVAIRGNAGEASRNLTDDGSGCTAYTTGYLSETCVHRSIPLPDDCHDVAVPGVSLPVNTDLTRGCAGCEAIRYNAVLYFRLEDLTQAATPKDHGAGSPDLADKNGCHRSYTTSSAPACPGGDDDREGNSHRYNPRNDYPFTRWDTAGRGNHGGSASCDADPANDTECHATRLIDIFYGRAPAPTARVWALQDTVGSAAPYHCHEDFACDEADFYEDPRQAAP